MWVTISCPQLKQARSKNTGIPSASARRTTDFCGRNNTTAVICNGPFRSAINSAIEIPMSPPDKAVPMAAPVTPSPAPQMDKEQPRMTTCLDGNISK